MKHILSLTVYIAFSYVMGMDWGPAPTGAWGIVHTVLAGPIPLVHRTRPVELYVLVTALCLPLAHASWTAPRPWMRVAAGLCAAGIWIGSGFFFA